MFRTAEIQKDPVALVGIIILAYVLIFLLAPNNLMDFTVVDTEYWRETDSRLFVKSAYNYNDKESIEVFPKQLGDWDSIDFRYPESTYTKLNADIMLSRAYSNKGNIIWMDIIHSKVGESFHKQQICVEGQGWTIVNESTVQMKVGPSKYSPYTYLYSNRLDIEKKEEKQVILYWFMFKKFGSGNAVTMIRLSSPVENTYDENFDTMSRFVEDELFTAMYERVSETSTVADRLLEGSAIGQLVLALSLLFPLILIFNRHIRTRLRRK